MLIRRCVWHTGNVYEQYMQWTLCSWVRTRSKRKRSSTVSAIELNAWKYCLLAKQIGCEPFEPLIRMGLVERIHSKCSVFMRHSLLLLTFIYPLEPCFQANNSHFLRLLTNVLFALFLSSTQSHTLWMCVYVNGGQNAWIEHFGEQEIMRWGCCYARTDQSEQVRGKNHGQQQQLTQLHYTNLASPKKTDDSGMSESHLLYSVCLHKTSMRIRCDVRIQMIFFFCLSSAHCFT